jgi:N-acetyl-1-D-myo-inositol-2-amino-2-deoxy-alpha-D-glucopyranoside deacetylase
VHRVDLLGWIDSGVDGDPAPGSLCAASIDDVAASVARVIADVEPDVIVTLDGMDGHRDHAAIGRATVAAAGAVPTWYWCLPRSLLAPFFGNAEAGTPDELLTCTIDTSVHLETRWEAMRCHATQASPYDAMDEATQVAFLTADHLRPA